MLISYMTLQPLLSVAPYPHIVSVLAGGQENKIYEDDLDLKHNYGPIVCAFQGTTMMSLAFEHLAKENPNVAFLHVYPGYVNTGIVEKGFPWVCVSVPLSEYSLHYLRPSTAQVFLVVPGSKILPLT